MFTAQDGKKYAFNKGDYDVTYVYAKGSGWSDGHTPYPSQGEFEISISSGTHPVFVVHLRDSYFISEFGLGNFMDLVENRDFYWDGGYTDAKTLFGIDFYTLHLTWTPDEYDLQYLYNTQLKEDAGDLLGLNGDWTKRSGTKGTYADNHGFDLVIGSSGKPNYVDNEEDCDTCWSYSNGNYIVTMDGWYINWLFFTDYDSNKMKLAFLHEVFHSYDADDLEIYQINWIMTPWIISGGWNLHSGTEDSVTGDIVHFDGV
jgi:hypothetical protein